MRVNDCIHPCDCRFAIQSAKACAIAEKQFAVNQRIALVLARPRRFERPTPAFGGQYSIQLSYGRAEAWNIAFLAVGVHCFLGFTVPGPFGFVRQRQHTADNDQRWRLDILRQRRGGEICQRCRDEAFFGLCCLVDQCCRRTGRQAVCDQFP